MMTMLHKYAFVTVVALAVIACSKLEDDSESNKNPSTITPSETFNLMDHMIFFDTLLHVEGPSYTMKDTITTDAVNQGIDIHLEIIPIYAYGNNEYSGDYYAVNGYVIAHNGELDVRKISCRYPDYDYEWVTPFMRNLRISAVLLDKDGNDVSQGDVRFQNTPEPSTTIGSTTYNKGLTISLGFGITFGAKKDDGQWHPTLFPSLLPTFNWSNSSTQNLPDQTVEMNTDGITRAVRYTIKTNHSDTFNPDSVPVHAKTDQRVDFSWMWFVPKGRLSSVDYGTDALLMRFCVTPEYCLNYRYEYYGGSSYVDEFFDIALDCITPVEQRTMTVELGGLTRNPIGTLDFANATSNFVTGIKLVSAATGEEKQISGSYSRLKHLKTDLCAGEYSLYYTIKNGDTLKEIGKYVINGIVITEDSTFETSTLRGTKL